MLLVFLLTACTGTGPVPTSTPDENAVATAVATMMSGLATDTPLPEPTATPTPEPSTLLPRDLYYLNLDSNKNQQIYRLNRDGTSITQITFEQSRVQNYDISPVDGTIVYSTQGSLITVNKDGENRQILLQDPEINFPLLWSSDGNTIIYLSGRNMVVAYSLATGNSEVLLSGDDDETVSPVSISPDDRKLIIRKYVDPMGLGGTLNMYDLASRSITQIGEEGNDVPSPCYDSKNVWNTLDTLFCYKHVRVGGRWLGLWRVNVIDGSIETLISSESRPPCSPVAAPHQNGNGNLYYLYGENDDSSYPSLSLVRSETDGITNRVTLRPESFNVLNAIWTPNFSAIVIVQHDGIEPIPANMVLVPLDTSLPVVTLMAETGVLDANSLRWGS